MDNIRLFLWLTFLATGWLIYTAWVQDYPPAPITPITGSGPASVAPAATLPSLENGAAPPPDSENTAEHGELIRVRTDVLADCGIDPGSLRAASRWLRPPAISTSAYGIRWSLRSPQS